MSGVLPWAVEAGSSELELVFSLAAAPRISIAQVLIQQLPL